MQNFQRSLWRYAASGLYAAFASLSILGLVLSPLQPALEAAAAELSAALQSPVRAPLAAPTLAVSKADALFTDVDGDLQADPGDVLRYTVTMTNTGTDALGVTFNDTMDANTTLVSGSLNVAPIAASDVYTTVGNTLLEVGVTASGNPAVVRSGSLFANDVEFLGDTFSLTGASTTSAQGGQVTVNTNGSFTYLPPVGFTGTDTFTYTVADGVGSADGATVTINVAGRVWYVSNNASVGNGRSSTPFNTLAAAQAASAANDTIYVHTGDGATTNQNAGFSLQSGQRLIGQGVALTMPVNVDGVSPSVTLAVAGTAPQIGNSAGNGVSIVGVLNVEVQGLNIGGTANAVVLTTTTALTGTAEIANNTIRAAGLNGVDINQGGTGTLTLSLHDNVVTATSNGLDVQRTAGNLTITAFDDNVVSGNTGGTGVNIVGTGATILFDANPATAGFDTVQGGTTAIGQSGNGMGVGGLIIDNARGDLNFTDLDIFADNGRALFVDGTTANYTGSSGLRMTVGAGVATLSANGGAAAELREMNVNLALSLLTSNNSSGNGVSLFDVSGSFSAPTGSSITNATNAAFSINGNNASAANVAVNYAGTITDDIGFLVQVQNVVGTSTHTFSGAITDGDDGDGSGVSLTTNAGATITFSGGLVLSTGGNLAFTATGGGTVNVCDENPCNPAATGALINKITTTTGTALNMANTTIGAHNLEFRSISSNGAINGIVLNATGSSGGLKVKGNGGTCTSVGTCTGGAIQNTTGVGVSMNTTRNVSLNYLFIGFTGNAAISGFGMADGTGGVSPTLEIRNSRISSPGDADNESALYFGRITAVGNNSGRFVLADTVVEQFEENGVEIYNNTGTLTVDVIGTLSGLTDSTTKFDDNNDTHGQQGLLVTAAGTATINFNVSGVFFNNIEFTPLDIRSEGQNASIDVNWSGNVSINGGGPDNFPSGGGFQIVQDIGGSATFDIQNNYIRDLVGDGIVVIAEGPTSGRIQNNVISGSSLGDGIRIDTDQLLSVGPQPGNNFSVTILIQNNQIGNDVTFPGMGDDGIQILHRDGTKTLNLTIENNTIANTASEAIRYFTDADFSDGANLPNSSVRFVGNSLTNIGVSDVAYWQAQDSARLCLHLASNTFPVTGNKNISVNQSGTGALQITQANVAALASANTNSTASSSGTITFNGTCTNPPLPSHAMLKENHQRVAVETLLRKPIGLTRRATPAILASPTLEPAFAIIASRKALFRLAEPRPVLSGENININLGTLPAGEKYVITFRVTVDNPFPAGPTQVCNQGTFSGSNFSNLVTNDPDTPAAGDATCTPIDVKADLRLTKSDGVASAVPGETVIYTLNYTNAATSTLAATNTLITETLPANTTYAGSGWTLVSGSTYTRSVGTVNVGASGSVTFAVTINNPAIAGLTLITNTASIGFSGPEANAADNSATDTTPIVAAPDMQLTKSDGGAVAVPGGAVTYTLTYTNAGNQNATGVTLTETIPANTTFVGTGWSCAPNNNAGSTCTRAIGAVSGGGAGGSVPFAVQVANPAPAGVDQISNTASVADDGTNGADATPANNSASDTTPVNAAPEYAITKTDGATSVLAGQTLAYTLVYTNAGNQNGTGVTLTEQVPAGTAFNAGASTAGWSLVSGSTYTFTVGALNANASGTVTFGVTVDDPATVFVITNTVSIADDGANGADATPANNSATDVNIISVPPVLGAIGDKTVDEGVTLAFTATATDGNAPPQTLTFSLDAGAPSGASIGSSSGAFTWTPSEAQGPGVYTATVRVTDNGSPTQSDFETITITVNEANAAPVLGVIGAKSVNELATLTFTATVSDGDVPAQTLTFSLDAGAPSGASIGSSSGAFSWTPSETQGPGVYTVTVRVTDNGSPALDDFEDVVITVSEVNAAPVLGAIGNQNVNELATLTFTATVSDGDLPVQTLTFSLDAGAPSGASIDANSGAFTWTPTEAQGAGVYTATVRVTDDGSPPQNDFETITITVNEVNNAPVLGVIGNQNVDELATLAFTATVSDGDLPAQTLTFSLDAGAPSGASIGSSSGAFTWTPSEAQGPGIYTATVRVADNGSPVQEDFETITITVNEVNAAPVLGAIGNQNVNELATLTFTATVSDGDVPAQTLTFSLDAGAPSGASIGSSSGAFSWTPSETQGPGVYTVTVRVTDNGSPAQNDFEEITITVNEANQAPIADDDAFQVEVDSLNNTLDVLNGDTDADLPPQTLSILAVGTPSSGGTLFNNGITLSYTPTASFNGTETFTYTVSDGNGGTDTALVTVTVNSIRYLYLPLIARNYASGPDLVVESVTSNGNNVQVLIANRGTACVASAAEEFWVDVYINPTTPPNAVNQVWRNLGTQGLVWGVTASAFPLCPGQTRTLTVGDAYYFAADSVVSFPLPNGTQLYAQVDSFNPSTTYGTVRENHEIMGTAYNNISSGVVGAGPVSSDLPLPPTVFVERERDVNLPKRPN